MSNMEFGYASHLNTTTMITVDSGTSTAKYMFDRKNTTYYLSNGWNDDTTACTIRIDFGAAKNISRIVLDGINWKSFRIYYASNTANTFTLINGDTTTSQWSSNSSTAMLLKFATVSAQIITIDATTTIIANAEKQVSGLWFLETAYIFTDMPNAKSYDPNIEQKNYKHEMSDGGSAIYYIQDIFKATIKRDYVQDNERDSLFTLYSHHSPLVFIPFPTGTSDWNEEVYEVNWVDKFEFNQYTTNVKSNGRSGSIKLEETAK